MVHETRRQFITLLGGAAVGLTLALSLAGGIAAARSRVALLSVGAAQDDYASAFTDGMRRLGYVEGRSVDIDYRYAAGDVRRLEPLANELLALKPDVLIGAEPSAARAFKRIAPSRPIVCMALTDAFIPELMASYARPLGSVTGIAQSVEGVTGKLVELATEIVPGTVRIGFLANPEGASMSLFARSIDAGARDRGITVLNEQAATGEALGPAFIAFSQRGAQAVIVPVNGLFRTHIARLVQLSLAVRLPTLFADRFYVEAGGLASYGVDGRENYRRAAGYVDKILKGAKPGDLPVEFPTKIELAVNLRTAKKLGLTVPPALLARADEVVE